MGMIPWINILEAEEESSTQETTTQYSSISQQIEWCKVDLGKAIFPYNKCKQAATTNGSHGYHGGRLPFIGLVGSEVHWQKQKRESGNNEEHSDD